MASLHLALLGSFRATRDAHELHDFGYAKVRALLAYLASSGEAVERERLRQLLWPTLEPAKAAANLRHAVQAAGGTLADVAQVLIYMTDVADMPAIDAVYREFFEPPYPNRSSAAVAALVVPGMKLEIVAYAIITQPG